MLSKAKSHNESIHSSGYESVSHIEEDDDASLSLSFSSLRSSHSHLVSKVTLPEFMFHKSGFMRVKWDIFIIIVVLYNTFTIPYILGFAIEEMANPSIKAIGLINMIVFSGDIIMNFRTTYYDSTSGDEVFDTKEIAINYLKNRLVFDILAALPSEYFYDIPAFTLFKLTKLERILKVTNDLMFMKMTEWIKLFIRFCTILLWLGIYLHLLACFWFYLVNEQDDSHSWVPPCLSLDSNLKYLYESPNYFKYSQALYAMVFAYSGIEFWPRTTLQYAIGGILVLVGSIITAVVFGQISVIMASLTRESQRLSDLHDVVNTAMRNMKLPDELQMKITDYLTSSFKILDQQESYEDFSKLIPPSKKQKISACLFEKVFRESEFFEGNSQLIKFVLQKLDSQFFQPEYSVVNQFDTEDCIYFVGMGSCEVEVLDEYKNSHSVRILEPGSYFGEVSALYKTPRTASVKTRTYSTLAVITKPILGELLKKFPEVKQTFLNSVSTYKDNYKSFLKRTLARVPYFDNISPRAADHLIYSLDVENYAPNSYLFQQGQTIDKAFLILEGKVQIIFVVFDSNLTYILKNKHRHSSVYGGENLGLSSRSKKSNSGYGNLKGVKIVIDELGMGSVLCSRHLLMQYPATVICRVIEPTRVMVITNPDLEDLLVDFPKLKRKIEAQKIEMQVWDNFRQEYLRKQIPLDYSKCFKYDKTANRKAWKSKIKVKNEVIKLIMKKRNRKNTKVTSSVKAMVEKIRAIVTAEEKGHTAIALKISKGEIPPEALEVIDFLDSEKITNPVLTQFAIKTKELSKVVGTLSHKMSSMNEKLINVETACDDIGRKISRLQETTKALELSL
ncbi:unnamed protein product [Blepharisma stoltei]|uniref:Cyclic nucleotide-binding domain-containing protein n=1 Tax=Blepharisma stoltei TaxID=1481888 RepID=A0AAU9JBD0_9CILI|nr:unnamed protein product [Blepharisma stoltei]